MSLCVGYRHTIAWDTLYAFYLILLQGSRDVTDECVAHLSHLKLRELNIFNTNISINGLAGILQTTKGLAVLSRGVPICQALAAQSIMNEACWQTQKILKLQVASVTLSH